MMAWIVIDSDGVERAQPIRPSKPVPIGTAVETNTALPITAVGGIPSEEAFGLPVVTVEDVSAWWSSATVLWGRLPWPVRWFLIAYLADVLTGALGSGQVSEEVHRLIARLLGAGP